MIRFFAALLACICVAPAFAETIRWAMPAQNADGSAIPAMGDDALKHTEIQIGSCGTGGVFGTVQTTLKPLVPIVVQAWNPTLGAYCIRARVQNNAGVNSDWSAVLAYSKTAPKPGKVTLTITATVPP